ncbi:MAG: hypothetical protein M3Y05_12225 [Gemmatimonadota bacterium]|nr:hypothetical protein [Gemmatimonadota bacterium]
MRAWMLLLAFLFAVIACASPAPAQEMPDSGGAHHDMHHDAAPPGREPRLGSITFATSAAPAAHRAFIRGMLYMHNFHYPQAAAAFREAQTLDSGDVMSYWGEAVSYTHPVWNQQDTAAARAVLRRLAPTPSARLAKARTKRERAWLATAEALYDDDVSKARRDTLFSASLASLRARYPGDVEAQLFYALSLLGLNQGDRDVPTYLRAYAIARRVFLAHPKHPGAAHYVIHAVDDPAHASLGLDAARTYSRIAPDASHAQHMTSHIFIALGMWDDVIAANVRAQHPLRPGARVTYGHGVQWLAYGYLQEGRYAKAAGWVDSMRVQTARFAGGGDDSHDAEIESRSHLVFDRAAYIADTREWRSPLAMLAIDTASLGVHELAANDLALGLAALGRGEPALADSIVARFDARMARPHAGGDEEFASERGYAEVIGRVMHAAVMHARGEGEKAIAMLAAAAAQDDSLPFAFGPPVEIAPPHELAGEYLLELQRARDAEREYGMALARAPGRTAALIGLATAQLELGRRADARRAYLRAARNLAGADSAAMRAIEPLRARLYAPVRASTK